MSKRKRKPSPFRPWKFPAIDRGFGKLLEQLDQLATNLDEREAPTTPAAESETADGVVYGSTDDVAKALIHTLHQITSAPELRS